MQRPSRLGTRDLLASIERDRALRHQRAIAVVIFAALAFVVIAYAGSLLYAEALASIRHTFAAP